MSVEEEVERGEEDLFYESLDRILSSSGSSTSASDDDGADRPRHRRSCDAPAAAALDLWTSQPAPVHERRRRLLHLMGLTGDPSLAGFEIARSASGEAAGPPPASPVSWSRSGGAALGSAGKPPLGGGRLRFSLSDGSDAADEDPRCLIRNLDDGREYVVREEFALREVGTGRHLTVEELARSPIVQELMRRQSFSTPNSNCTSNSQSGTSTPIERSSSGSSNGGGRAKRRSSWLRSIRCVAGSFASHSRDRRSSDEKDASPEKGGHHSSSTTDDSQDSVPRHGPARVKVRQYGKSYKELSGLFMTQEIQAHSGSIWSIKFSPDGRYLATAGEDCVIHVWEVLEFERARKENEVCNPLVAMVCNESSETTVGSAAPSESHWEKKLRSKVLHGGGSVSSDRLMVPDYVFALSEKPVITFAGHSEDVLDLSWSKSQFLQYLLSSSMDKTVRLWHMSSTYCLKTFSHTDYVTCIQFNPVDDRYFISGSLDEKVRIWSIPKREIVDWVDLHEMVTAACYTPDGKGALVGSHKGSCHLYDTSGFRNTSSQISACLAGNGRYIISASEDSHVYIWRNNDGPKPSRKKGIVSVTDSHEYFHCQSVTVAVTWPFASTAMTCLMNPGKQEELERGSEPQDLQTKLAKAQEMPDVEYRSTNITSNNSNHNNGDRTSPTWPEKLNTPPNQSLRATTCHANEGDQALNRSAWGLVIVTAGRGGQIRTFQNFGFPVRV
ncbi:putative WD repeat-containing protein C3H5.08c [Zea mays]|uniref:Putative WD repeat-containing protein C3H5.08c n=1 Tax=Zea mays TaxID=4577 RepID=A0A3L6EID7_MAIZE|nr:putative WD repeat-containing protein C3H5.08c [Zea mays]